MEKNVIRDEDILKEAVLDLTKLPPNVSVDHTEQMHELIDNAPAINIRHENIPTANRFLRQG